MSSVKNISVLTASLALLVTGICAARATSVIKTTLRGQLLKSDGRPLANTEIELVPLESAKLVIDGRLNGISSASGRFLFVDVPPGEYTLSINFDDKPTELSPYDTFFYPNTYDRSAASVFRIDSSTILKDVEFRLPQALQKKSIVGRVIWEDGRPIEDALIGFWDLSRIRALDLVRLIRIGTAPFKWLVSRDENIESVQLYLTVFPRLLWNRPATLLGEVNQMSLWLVREWVP